MTASPSLGKLKHLQNKVEFCSPMSISTYKIFLKYFIFLENKANCAFVAGVLPEFAAVADADNNLSVKLTQSKVSIKYIIF